MNFDPDRLYEIERDIVEKVELPKKMTKDFVTYVFQIDILFKYICDVKEAREKREKMREAWENGDIEM